MEDFLKYNSIYIEEPLKSTHGLSKAGEQRNAHIDSQLLAPTEIFLVNRSFTLALCHGPTLKDPGTNSPIKLVDVVTTTVSWGYCSLCHSVLFMRTQRRNFSLNSVPGIIVLLLSNRWVFFLWAPGNMFSVMFSSFLWRLQNSSQTWWLASSKFRRFYGTLEFTSCFLLLHYSFIFSLQFI